jgi:WD40 repeat protein
MSLARKTILSAVIGAAVVLTACSNQTPPSNTWALATQGAYDAALSSDGSMGVIASINHGGSLWQLPQHERVYNWNHQADKYSLFNQVAISGDGRYGATAEQDRLTLWDATSGKPANFLALPNDIRSLDLSEDGAYLLAGLDNSTAVLISTSQGQGIKTFTTDDQVTAVGFSADNSLAIAGTRTGSVYVWSLPDGEVKGQWSHDNQIRSVALSPRSGFAFSSAQGGSAVAVDLNSGKIAMNMDVNRGGDIAASTYTAAEFSAEQPLLLTGSSTGKVKLWNLATKEQVAGWEATKRDKWKPSAVSLMDLAFSRDGRYRALASNGLAYEFSQ